MLDWSSCPEVERQEGKVSGAWVFRGTRVPVKALFENVVWKDGRMANNQMTNYIIPTPVDIPPIRVYFEENPYAYGPGGAKGIGELPMDGPAPAILNAIENATGASFKHIPLMPESLMQRYEQDPNTVQN